HVGRRYSVSAGRRARQSPGAERRPRCDGGGGDTHRRRARVGGRYVTPRARQGGSVRLERGPAPVGIDTRTCRGDRRVNRRLVGLYHRLPTPARNAAAAMRGLYLRAWRYGSETDCMADEAIDREQWSAAQWSEWRAERLSALLERAATRVPYYREQWAARRRAGDRASRELLENWPILEKETVRRLGVGLLADDCESGKMFHEHTSGTTGTSL